MRLVDSRTWMLPPLTKLWGSPVEKRYQVFPSFVMLGSWMKT